jgi:hypothetical protein
VTRIGRQSAVAGFDFCMSTLTAAALIFGVFNFVFFQ